VPEYSVELVEGVAANRERIDELISSYAVGWTIERMPAVDRNVLRMGIYELLWRDEVPDAVVIDEAVALARTLSTDDSPRFVNGLLARLLDLKPTLQRCPAGPDQPADLATRVRGCACWCGVVEDEPGRGGARRLRASSGRRCCRWLVHACRRRAAGSPASRATGRRGSPARALCSDLAGS
jgi:transcription antitermination factor NusB